MAFSYEDGAIEFNGFSMDNVFCFEPPHGDLELKFDRTFTKYTGQTKKINPTGKPGEKKVLAQVTFHFKWSADYHRGPPDKAVKTYFFKLYTSDEPGAYHSATEKIFLTHLSMFVFKQWCTRDRQSLDTNAQGLKDINHLVIKEWTKEEKAALEKKVMDGFMANYNRIHAAEERKPGGVSQAFKDWHETEVTRLQEELKNYKWDWFARKVKKLLKDESKQFSITVV